MSRTRSTKQQTIKVVELFAGVGGFRLGLEAADERFRVVWSNQWEPSTSKQDAADCYVQRFGLQKRNGDSPNPLVDEGFWRASRNGETFWCADIARINDVAEYQLRERGRCTIIPRHDLLVGGFPCQDYSVAKPKNQAHGIEGVKGVLWWEIHRILRLRRPKYVLLENVDRLLKSPARQRGRDFAILLASMADLGYSVEWRVVNAADYGAPQRRRRVFIFGERRPRGRWQPISRLRETGVLARALPVKDAGLPEDGLDTEPHVVLEGELHQISASFGVGLAKSPFRNSGVMQDRCVWTFDLAPDHSGPFGTLGDILLPLDRVPEDYLIPRDQIERWAYLKGPKDEARTHKKTGAPYRYQEGGMDWDRPENPARTILTGEGGASPSRFKHVVPIDEEKGLFRRLTPEELEMLNGFPPGWTDTGMTPIRRAFCMGNALVVDIVRRIGESIAQEAFGDAHPPRT